MKYNVTNKINPDSEKVPWITFPHLIHSMSPRDKDKLLAWAISQFFNENIEPNRRFSVGGFRRLGGDEFFRWLFAPITGYIAKHPKPTKAEIKSGHRRDELKPSIAMVIARHFFQSKLIRPEMGRVDVMYYFAYAEAKREFGFPDWKSP